MERIRNLNRYQKGILILMLAMILIFGVLYVLTTSRVGYEYQDRIFVPNDENGSTIYSGKLKGERAEFIVSGDQTVTFRRGDKTYGPYIVKEDPAAVPVKYREEIPGLIGVEIRKGSEIVFRGGYKGLEDYLWLYDEDGISNAIVFTYVDSMGNTLDEDGNIIDPFEPSAATILELTMGPELIHKGYWLGWFGAMFICLINVVSILFADELFRFNMAFRVWNVEDLEPSDLEIAGRYIGWTTIPILALNVFIRGLM